MILVLITRVILVLSAFAGIITGVYYTLNFISRRTEVRPKNETMKHFGSCQRLMAAKTDINTFDEYSTMDFKVPVSIFTKQQTIKCYSFLAASFSSLLG